MNEKVSRVSISIILYKKTYQKFNTVPRTFDPHLLPRHYIEVTIVYQYVNFVVSKILVETSEMVYFANCIRSNHILTGFSPLSRLHFLLSEMLRRFFLRGWGVHCLFVRGLLFMSQSDCFSISSLRHHLRGNMKRWAESESLLFVSWRWILVIEWNFSLSWLFLQFYPLSRGWRGVKCFISWRWILVIEWFFHYRNFFQQFYPLLRGCRRVYCLFLDVGF